MEAYARVQATASWVMARIFHDNTTKEAYEMWARVSGMHIRSGVKPACRRSKMCGMKCRRRPPHSTQTTKQESNGSGPARRRFAERDRSVVSTCNCSNERAILRRSTKW
jgi:hypothetical protein